MATAEKPKAGLEDVVATVVAHLFPRRRSRRARVLRPRHSRPGAQRDVRGDVLPAVARPPAEPRRAWRSAVAAGRRAAAAGGDPPADEDAAAVGRHGRAAHADLGARPLRSGRARQLAAGVVSQGGAADRPDRQHRRDVGTHAGGRRTDRARSGDGPRRQLPLHAVRRPSEPDRRSARWTSR